MNNKKLPKGWEIKKLGEVLKLQYGKALEKTKRLENGKYPVYGANGEKARSDFYHFGKKTIIIGRKGSRRVKVIFRSPLICYNIGFYN